MWKWEGRSEWWEEVGGGEGMLVEKGIGGKLTRVEATTTTVFGGSERR